MTRNQYILESDEIRFLVGSTYVDALAKNGAFSVFTTHFGVSAAIRREGAMTAERAAAILKLPDEQDVYRTIAKFHPEDKAISARYAVGEALMENRISVAGFLQANLILVRRRLAGPATVKVTGNRSPIRHMPPPAETIPADIRLESWDDTPADALDDIQLEALDDSQLNALDAAQLEVRAAIQLEAWDDIQPRGLSSISNVQLKASDANQLEVRDAIQLDAWDDIQAAPDGFLTEDDVPEAHSWSEKILKASLPKRGGSIRKGTLKNADSEWLENWLLSLGHKNSGVRIDDYVQTIARYSTPAVVQAVRKHVQNDNQLEAIETLHKSMQKRNLQRAAMQYLGRLHGVLSCIEHGIELPEPACEPVYEPVPGRVFYMVHMRDPFENNGYVARTHLVLKALSGSGIEPVPITRLGYPNDLARHRTVKMADQENVKDYVFHSLPDSNKGMLRRPIDEYIHAYADRIVEIAMRLRPMAIHAASNHVNGLAAIIAARRLGIPSVYEVRGIWEITQSSADAAYSETLRYRMQRRLENQAVAAADRVATISEPLRRFVIEHGADTENVVVVPNGVDSSKLRPIVRQERIKKRLQIPADAVVIGYIGSVVHYEGLDFLIQALSNLKKLHPEIPQFQFLLVGDGTALKGLKDLANDLGLHDVCHFLGRVPHSEVEALYSIIDIAPFPRRSLQVTELVPPLKPFEAMAGAKAVIVSSVEAIAGTVIDEETGLIVEKNNVEALTNALRRLIEDSDLRQTLGTKAREWVVSERSVDALSRHTSALYGDLELGLHSNAQDG